MSDWLSDEDTSEIRSKAENALRNGLKRVAEKQYGIKPWQIDVEWDYGSDVVANIEVNHTENKVKIITCVRPTDWQNCGQVLKNALESIHYMKLLKSTALELHETAKRRNEAYASLYEHKPNRSLLPESEIEELKVTTIILNHKKTGQSIALTSSDSGISIWNLRAQAHIMLSEKVKNGGK